ncbi:MAG: antitoxin family protein [Euryarchaeota archaeon]|nr:antitoxin family protein [Euryarchaeota archaeon]
MGIKAIFRDEVIMPLEKLNFHQGEEIEIVVRSNMTKKMAGIVKCYQGLEDVHEKYESDIHRC